MIIMKNSSLGIYWCSDCGEETTDLGHYCLPDEDEERYVDLNDEDR